jgi:ATP-dependent Clp protease protease subunit
MPIRFASQLGLRAYSNSARLRQDIKAWTPMPYITETIGGGWRTSDIFSKLLQERIVCLNGEVNETVSAAVVAQLLWLESDNPDKAITLYINSPGGSVTAGNLRPTPQVWP